jgi:hypothetical protein
MGNSNCRSSDSGKTSDKLCSAGLYGLAGFAFFHTIVILPIITKRLSNEYDFAKFKNEIDKLIQKPEFQPIKEQISDLTSYISNISLSTNERGNASQTLGYKKRLIECAFNKLNEQIENSLDIKEVIAFWSKEPKILIQALDPQPNSKVSNSTLQTETNGQKIG